ncbi:extracellular solute-binding protein [Nitratireductor sp. XY-223]|uniref:extracellular solute-binding protein n=1 Tax=Nitratireductor sp. XY-223 TaxID=2561926 RepID=UPI0010AA4680|nr:extracellular solute-binding protein [Nitratireductor sp. XY-223]
MLKLLKTTSLAAVGLALCAAGALADPYEEHRGKTLVVNFPAHPHFNAVMKVLPEFTKETGINVEVDQLQYLAMREKQTLELTKNKGDYDLIAYVVFSKADYVYADQIEPLARFFMDPELANPNYDPEDLIDGYVQNIGVAGGKKGYLPGPTGALFGIPFGSETSVLGYRKDIFDKHGLKVPETYDELLELACKIPELEPGMGGLASRGKSGHQTSHAFLLHLAPMGGKVLDDQWNPVINSPEAVRAGEALKTILDCGPDGATSFGFAEAKNAFLQGQTAMFLDSTVVAGEVENPEKSKVVGKVGWAPHPIDVRAGSQTGGFGIAIPKNAQEKEAAFLLMQWLTGKEADKKIALEGGNPSRFSTHADPDVNAKYPHMAVFGEALKNADPDWRPIIPVWGKINSELGTTLSKAMTGEMSVQEALDIVAERTQGIMADAGYDTWKQ